MLGEHLGTISGPTTMKALPAVGGAPTEDGGMSFKGVVYFEPSAPSLASLAGVAVIYDWIVDPEGNAPWDLWEWN